jgi:rubrerythrin
MSKTCNFENIIDLAIKEEIASINMYKKAYQLTNNKEIKKMLKMLIDTEQEHVNKLEKLKINPLIDKNIEIKLNTYEQKTLIDITKIQNIKELLKIAIKAEEKASNMYKELSEMFKEDQIHKFFKKMEQEENTHYLILEKQLKVIDYL